MVGVEAALEGRGAGALGDAAEQVGRSSSSSGGDASHQVTEQHGRN